MDIIKRLERHRGRLAHQKRVRYPAEIRRAAGAYYKQQVDSGRKRHDVARDLGVHANTLDCWRGKPRDNAPVAAFREVVVKASKRTETATVVVHCPGGLRVEGLGIAELAELVRALA